MREIGARKLKYDDIIPGRYWKLDNLIQMAANYKKIYKYF